MRVLAYTKQNLTDIPDINLVIKRSRSKSAKLDKIPSVPLSAPKSQPPADTVVVVGPPRDSPYIRYLKSLVTGKSTGIYYSSPLGLL